MAKLTPISGFPEWLPEQKLVEDAVISQVKSVYASHGFVPIETPAAELIETLSSKGVVDREIYSIRRFHAEEDAEAALALHFDLTVPFARYAAQHLNALSFPFKRYQLQKVWRGERPQKGRFREFYQFDIDTIAREDLPLCCDAEIVTVLLKAFRVMQLGPFQMLVNNRKLLHGCYSSLGLGETQRKAAITAVDKIHKIGRDGVLKELESAAAVSHDVATRIVDLTVVQASAADFAGVFQATGVKDALFDKGIEELAEVLRLVPTDLQQYIQVDLSLARGLDYYTGLIFEAQMRDHPEFGTVCSGGRYDDLASQFTSQKLPGVGGSIGLTRLLELAFSKGLLSAKIRSTAQVMVTVFSETQRQRCNEFAEELRGSGVATEVFFKASKLGKQIESAEARGVRYVAFVSEENEAIEIKDLETKQQHKFAQASETVAWLSALKIS